MMHPNFNSKSYKKNLTIKLLTQTSGYIYIHVIPIPPTILPHNQPKKEKELIVERERGKKKKAITNSLIISSFLVFDNN